MTQAHIYVRFSDRRDSEHCQSNETQLAICRDYCAKHNYEIIGEHPDDAISGAEEDRPVLWNAIDSLRRGMVLVVYRSDRLARNVYLHEMIYRAVAEKRATIEVVDGSRNGDTAEDELVRVIFAAFAQYERRIIAARTKAASLRHQANGRAVSKEPPYGKQEGPLIQVGDKMKRTWIENADEQMVIERIMQLHRDGMGVRQIARQLNDDGVPARAEKWRHALVGRIIGREGAKNGDLPKMAATESLVTSADDCP